MCLKRVRIFRQEQTEYPVRNFQNSIFHYGLWEHNIKPQSKYSLRFFKIKSRHFTFSLMFYIKINKSVIWVEVSPKKRRF